MAYPADNFKGAVGNRAKPTRGGGRPRKLSKVFIKDNNLSSQDTALLLKNAFLTPLSQLQDEANNGQDTLPSIVSITHKMVVSAYNSGRVADMKDLYELAFGKEKEVILIETVGKEKQADLDTIFITADYEVIN